MATGVEAAVTAVSIIGFSAQIFDGCVKGFVLLSSARNLGRDGDMFRCMLDWEQFRLEQWAERIDLLDSDKVDLSLDWRLVETTLEHMNNLLNDTTMLKKKYGLDLTEDPPEYASQISYEDTTEKHKTGPFDPFKKLFSQSENSNAASKVIQSRNHPLRKLWWAAVDKNGLRRLIEDISHFNQRLYDVLNASVQDQMKASIDAIIQNATARSENVLELAVMRQIARLPDIIQSSTRKAEEIEEDITQRSVNLFFYAIRKGSIDEIEALLDEGLDIESEDHIGWSALIRASEAGNLSTVELLLRRRANPLHGTIGNRLPIHFAAEYGHDEIVKTLLPYDLRQINFEDFVKQTPLHKAAREGRRGVVEFLVSVDGVRVDVEDQDGWRPLMQAVGKQDADIVRILLAQPSVDPNVSLKGHGQTPLWMAITIDDDCQILKSLLERPDLDLDQKSRFGEASVYRAVRWSKDSALQLVLEKGADANLANEEGRTPLSIAASEGKHTGMGILLKQPNINLDQRDENSKTPTMYASEANQTQCLKLLLASRPTLEAQDKEGRTALSFAAIKGNKIPAKLLLKAGANINTQDRKGNTPLALAAEHNHDVVARFLLENGADMEIADEDEETPFEKARDRKLEDVISVFKEVLKI